MSPKAVDQHAADNTARDRPSERRDHRGRHVIIAEDVIAQVDVARGGLNVGSNPRDRARVVGNVPRLVARRTLGS